MITSPATGEPVHFDPNASQLWAALSTLRRATLSISVGSSTSALELLTRFAAALALVAWGALAIISFPCSRTISRRRLLGLKSFGESSLEAEQELGLFEAYLLIVERHRGFLLRCQQRRPDKQR